MDNKLILELINKHITNFIMQFSYMAMENNNIKEYCIKNGIHKAINEYIKTVELTMHDIKRCDYEYFENVLKNSNENVL